MKITIEMNVYELNRTITSGTLQALVTDVQALENEARKVQGQAAPVEKKNVPEAASKVVNEAAATVEDSKETEEPKVSETEIRAKFVALSKAGKKEELKTLLTDMGVEKVSDLKPEQYNEAWARLEAI